MINSNDPNEIRNLLDKTNYKASTSATSEYRDQFNAERLYEEATITQSYVTKRANTESEFWKSGKSAFEDKKIQQEVIYKTTSRHNHTENPLPNTDKEHNMRKTRISQYSNALYNGTVFINPTHLSC